MTPMYCHEPHRVAKEALTPTTEINIHLHCSQAFWKSTWWNHTLPDVSQWTWHHFQHDYTDNGESNPNELFNKSVKQSEFNNHNDNNEIIFNIFTTTQSYDTNAETNIHMYNQPFNYNRLPRRPPFLRVQSEGMGVTSSTRPIFMPERARARKAAWAAGLGVRPLEKWYDAKPILT